MKKNRKYWDFSKKSCISAFDYRIRYKRRDGRAVEYSSLENCCAVTGTGGSNPSLSAFEKNLCLAIVKDGSGSFSAVRDKFLLLLLFYEE